MNEFISIIGGINIDIKGVADSENFECGSHPGRIHFSPGGVARNMAENLSRLEIPVKIFGCVGKDYFGNFILDKTSSIGVNTEQVLKISGVNTSVYLSISDNSNNRFFAVNDMERCMEFITADYIRENSKVLKESSLIALDTNISAEVLNEIVRFANENNIPVFIDTVSEVKSKRISEIDGTVDYLSPNRSEFEKLFGEFSNNEDLLEMVKNGKFDKFKYVLLKKDIDGVDLICSAEKAIYNIDPILTKVIESSGAGDAFNAGFIFSILNSETKKQDVLKAVKMGICTASFALESFESVSENITKKRLQEFYIKNK